eukprot:gene44433-17833_t
MRSTIEVHEAQHCRAALCAAPPRCTMRSTAEGRKAQFYR